MSPAYSQLLIGTDNGEIEARIVMGRLEAEGIDSEMKKDDVGGMHPHLQLTQGVTVLVEVDDYDQAKAIIEFDEADAGADTWICGGCGETHGGQFTECWNCGATREA